MARLRTKWWERSTTPLAHHLRRHLPAISMGAYHNRTLHFLAVLRTQVLTVHNQHFGNSPTP